MGLTWNDIRRRAGIVVEAGESEILPPGTSAGEDAIDPSEARDNHLQEIQTDQEQKLLQGMIKLGFDAEELTVSVTYYADPRGNKNQDYVEYAIWVGDTYGLSIAVVLQMIQMGLISNETMVSSGRNGSVDFETKFAASETVFAQFAS